MSRWSWEQSTVGSHIGYLEIAPLCNVGSPGTRWPAHSDSWARPVCWGGDRAWPSLGWWGWPRHDTSMRHWLPGSCWWDLWANGKWHATANHRPALPGLKGRRWRKAWRSVPGLWSLQVFLVSGLCEPIRGQYFAGHPIRGKCYLRLRRYG